jgi:hypothetical protein
VALPTVTPEALEKLKDMIVNKKTTVERIKTQRTLTAEQETELYGVQV